jgi:hypothetical protein
MKHLPLLALAGAIAASAALAAPPGARDPDWPCFQIKVPALSLGSVWTGPPVDAFANTWSQDPQVADLVGRVVQRRLPLDGARRAIDEFAAHAGGQKQDRLLAVMAGIYSALNAERGSVLAGLDRYGRRQKVLAEQVRDEVDALHAQQAAATPDDQAIAQAAARVTWDSRVFEDRRQSVSTACEIPTIIEQRFFALAQAVQHALADAPG